MVDEQVEQLNMLHDAWNSVKEQKSPQVVHIQGGSGLGKTRVLQRFYDSLAHPDNYFAPGLAPVRIPSRAELDETRRRLLDPDCLQPSKQFDWLWIGVRCLPVTHGVAGLGGGSQVGQVVDQITFHTAYIQAHRELKGTHLSEFAKVLIKLAAAFNPPAAVVKELYDGSKSVRQILSAWKTLDARREDPTSDLAEARRRAAVELLRPIGEAPVCVVVDDAHQASGHLADLLAAILRKDPKERPRGARFFGSGEPGANRSLLVVVASWPTAFGDTPMTRWFDELRQNTNMLHQGGPGPPTELDRSEASRMVVANVEWLAGTPQEEALLEHLALRTNRINPLALVDALARIKEAIPAENPAQLDNDFIRALPQTPEEAGRQRFEQLPAAARAGVVLATGIDYQFPARIPIDLLSGLGGNLAEFNYSTFHEACDPHSYCQIAEPGSEAPMEVWEFADDHAFHYARRQFDGPEYAWVRALIPQGFKAFEDLAGYLREDLNIRSDNNRSLHILGLSRLGTLYGPAAATLLRECELSDRQALKGFLQVLHQASQPRYLRDGPTLRELGQFTPAQLMHDERDDVEAFLALWIHWFAQSLISDHRALRLRAEEVIKQVSELAPRSSLTVQMAIILLKSRNATLRRHAMWILSKNTDCLEAAVALAPIIARTSIEQLPRLLSRHAESSSQVALDLVGRYHWTLGNKHERGSPQRKDVLFPAIGILKPHAEHNPDAASKLASVYRELGDTEKQLNTLAKWSGISPTVTQQYVRAFRKSGRLDEAMRAVKPNVGQFPDDAKIALEWALLSDSHEAREHLSSVVDTTNPSFRSDFTHQIWNADDAISAIGEEGLDDYLQFLISQALGSGEIKPFKVRGLAALIGTHLLREKRLAENLRDPLWSMVAAADEKYDGAGLAELALARAEEPKDSTGWSIQEDELRRIATHLAAFASEHPNSARQLGRIAIFLGDNDLAKDAYRSLIETLETQPATTEVKEALVEVHHFLNEDGLLRLREDPEGWRLS